MPTLIACLWLLLSLPACAPTTAAPARSPQAQTATEAEHHSTHGLHKDFSDAPAFAAHFDDPARDAWQRPSEVIARLHIEPGSSVVDLGAGTGYFLEALSKAVGPDGRVLALDVEPEMIAFMQRRISEQGLANVEPRRVASDDPGLAPRSVARVLIVNTWHHLDRRDAYAKKLAEALQPGGEIWVIDFTLESDLGPPVGHRIAPGQVLAELKRAGLHAEVIQPEELPKQYLIRAHR
jgi:predicted methyltransferase